MIGILAGAFKLLVAYLGVLFVLALCFWVAVCFNLITGRKVIRDYGPSVPAPGLSETLKHPVHFDGWPNKSSTSISSFMDNLSGLFLLFKVVPIFIFIGLPYEYFTGKNIFDCGHCITPLWVAEDIRRHREWLHRGNS